MHQPARLAAFASIVIAFGCSGSTGPEGPATPATPAVAAAAPAPCSSQTLSFGPAIPPDFSQVSADKDADCFGWQQFIALNFPQSGNGFGTPGDTSQVQWQGWMNIEQIFRPDGTPPPAWGTAPDVTESCLSEAGLTATTARNRLALSGTSKFARGDSKEAFPSNAPAWLGDVNGNNVWYEVRVDEDEYNFIVGNKLFTAAGQAAWYAANPTGVLTQPAGGFRPSKTTGSMEVKAAWMEVPDPTNPRWNDYKVSDAVVVDPATQKCQAVTVALVGMHIIHKTQGQPTWIWSTFEHVRNAPDDSAASKVGTWNFYNAACTPQTVAVPALCQFNNQASVTTSCAANLPPQFYIGDGCPAPTPIQVTRLNAIDPAASAANQAVWSAIGAAYQGGSVWNNYALVNVLWSTNVPISQPRSVPQSFNSPQPNAPVANTTLETYVQNSKCIDCHRGATMAGSQTLPSDFSFVYSNASVGTTTTLKAGTPRPAARRIIK